MGSRHIFCLFIFKYVVVVQLVKCYMFSLNYFEFETLSMPLISLTFIKNVFFIFFIKLTFLLSFSIDGPHKAATSFSV